MADISPIDVQKALKGAHYPASAKDLAGLARDNGADDRVAEKLESASGGKEYGGPDDVQKAIFGKG